VTSVYAESSAVLAWLLGEPEGGATRSALSAASHVVSSVLTTVEVRRTLHRLTATGVLTPEERQRALARYSRAASRWDFYELSAPVCDRAGEAFAVEPVRTLDALHLATASLHAAEVEPPIVVSTDERVRKNAAAAGLDVAPDWRPP
jgi:predicted nucleic acid-binding protein